jgi:hypothetical protein
MASAKGTLSQMFSWCPLGPRRIPTARPQVESPSAITSSDVAQAQPPRHEGHSDGIVPDLRQCEPWRYERLRETISGNDTTSIDRLSR